MPILIDTAILNGGQDTVLSNLAGLNDSDSMLMFLGESEQGVLTVPLEFVEESYSPYTNTMDSRETVRVYQGVVSGSPTSYTISSTLFGRAMPAALFELEPGEGVGDRAANLSTPSSDTSIDSPSVTPVNSTDIHLIWLHTRGTTEAANYTLPSGFTEVANIADINNRSQRLIIATETLSSSFATGVKTWGGLEGTGFKIAGSIIITQQAAAGPVINGPASSVDGTLETLTGLNFDINSVHLQQTNGLTPVVQTISTSTSTTANITVSLGGITTVEAGSPVAGCPSSNTIDMTLSTGAIAYELEWLLTNNNASTAKLAVSISPPEGWAGIQSTISELDITSASVADAAKIEIEDNMQFFCPKTVSGTTVTLGVDGVITLDADVAIEIPVTAFAPSTGQLSRHTITTTPIDDLTLVLPDYVRRRRRRLYRFIAFKRRLKHIKKGN